MFIDYESSNLCALFCLLRNKFNGIIVKHEVDRAGLGVLQAALKLCTLGGGSLTSWFLDFLVCEVEMQWHHAMDLICGSPVQRSLSCTSNLVLKKFKLPIYFCFVCICVGMHILWRSEDNL